MLVRRLLRGVDLIAAVDAVLTARARLRRVEAGLNRTLVSGYPEKHLTALRYIDVRSRR